MRRDLHPHDQAHGLPPVARHCHDLRVLTTLGPEDAHGHENHGGIEVEAQQTDQTSQEKIYNHCVKIKVKVMVGIKNAYLHLRCTLLIPMDSNTGHCQEDSDWRLAGVGKHWILITEQRAIHDDPSIPLGWIVMAELRSTQVDPSTPLGWILTALQRPTQRSTSVDATVPIGWILMAEQIATPGESLLHTGEHQQLHHHPQVTTPSTHDDETIPKGWKLVTVPPSTQDYETIPKGWKLVTMPPGTQNGETVAAGWILLTMQPHSTDELTYFDGHSIYPARSIFNGEGTQLNITAETAIPVPLLYKDIKEEEHENLLESQEVQPGVETVEADAGLEDHDQHQGRVHQQVNGHESPPLQEGSYKVDQRDQVKKINYLPKNKAIAAQAFSRACLEVHHPVKEILLHDHCLHQEARRGLKRQENKAKQVVIDLEPVPAVAQLLSRLPQSASQSGTSSQATWLDNKMLGSASAFPPALYPVTRATNTAAETATNTEMFATLVLWGQILHHNHLTPKVKIQANQLSLIFRYLEVKPAEVEKFSWALLFPALTCSAWKIG